MAFPDLDVSHPSAEEVKTFTDATTALEATANSVRTARDEIQRGASGNKINVQTAVLTEIEQKLRDAATKTAKVAAAMKVLREAGDTWLKVAPKKAEIEAAEKEVETAREVMAMADRMGVPSGPPAAKFEEAKKELREMLEKRKAADDAYNAACKKAAGMVAEVGPGSGAPVQVEGGSGRSHPGADGGNGTGSGSGASKPVADTGRGATSPTPGVSKPSPSGTPAATRPGDTPAPSKLSGTPAATHSGDKPASQTLASSTSSPEAALAALLAQQQGRQGQAQQPAAVGGPPVAGLPQQAERKPGEESNAGNVGPITSDALERFIGAPLPLNSPNAASTAPTAPSPGGGGTAATAPTAPRPLGGGAMPAQPAVTGTSVGGITTPADVSGRSAPTPGAFSEPGAGTNTSGAHGNGNQNPGLGRGTGPGGIPMGGMPMGGMPMGGAGGSGNRGRGEGGRGVLAENPLLDGSLAADEAVKHGTIVRKDDP